MATVVTLTITLQVVEDPKDNMFVECAVAGQADYIVSNDDHLLTLRRYEK